MRYADGRAQEASCTDFCGAVRRTSAKFPLKKPRRPLVLLMFEMTSPMLLPVHGQGGRRRRRGRGERGGDGGGGGAPTRRCTGREEGRSGIAAAHPARP